MLISAHFPVNALKKGLRKVDFPFVLAHMWPQAAYRNILHDFKNTFAIVDNGVHENGTPLGVDRVAGVLDDNPGWIGILPDKIHKPIWTWKSLIQTVGETGMALHSWGAVLHGNSREQIHFQHDLACELGVGLICFPYKARRWDYLDPHSIDFRWGQRYHLMGLAEEDKLETYSRLPGKWSIDTMKIWKVDLTHPNWHGVKVGHVFHEVNWDLVDSNLNYLRGRFHGGTPERISSVG